MSSKKKSKQWFRLSLKNIVFDINRYLKDPFTPPRIHKVKTPDGLIADGFWHDNNIYYISAQGLKKNDDDYPNSIVPRRIAFAEHWTWLNDERSKRKIAYQEARNWDCSFAWGPKGLMFNETYYKKKKKPLPKVCLQKRKNSSRLS
jgi:hypothetical protein